MRKITFTDEQAGLIVSLYIGPEPQSPAIIATRLRVSKTPIYRFLRDQGLMGPKKLRLVYPVVDGKKQCRICRQWKEVKGNYSLCNRRSWRSECNRCRVDELTWVNRKKSFGISRDRYEALLSEQAGVCAICKQPDTVIISEEKGRRALAVDHDHETGTVRGLLCSWCNRSVGFLREDPDLAMAVACYLKKWKGQSSCSGDNEE